MIIILTLLVVFTATMAIGLIWRQVKHLRRGLTAVEQNPLLVDIFRRKIDEFTIKVNLVVRLALRWAHFHFLIFGRKVFFFSHHLIARIDQQFSKMIHATHGGRHETSKTGQASFFLTEIKNFRDKTGPGRIDA